MLEDLIKGKKYKIISTENNNCFKVGDIVVATATGWTVRCVLEKDWNSGNTKSYYSNWISPNVVVPVDTLETFELTIEEIEEKLGYKIKIVEEK